MDSLQGHLRSLECYPAGEVGAVVLGPRGEVGSEGVEGVWVHGINGVPSPGEQERVWPTSQTGEQAAGQRCVVARLQRLQELDVGFLWRKGDEETEMPGQKCRDAECEGHSSFPVH